jgi:predicted nuclease with TOPRIM domain
MEKEAYERARALDVATIERQAKRLKELEEEADETEIELRQLHTANANLEDRSDRLAYENRQLRAMVNELQIRVTKVQRGMDPESADRIRIREKQIPTLYCRRRIMAESEATNFFSHAV